MNLYALAFNASSAPGKVHASDTLIVGAGVRSSPGTGLTITSASGAIALASDVAVAAGKNLALSDTGRLYVGATSGGGLDVAAPGQLYVGATNATTMHLGRAGQTTRVVGDLTVVGDATLGGTKSTVFAVNSDYGAAGDVTEYGGLLLGSHADSTITQSVGGLPFTHLLQSTLAGDIGPAIFLASSIGGQPFPTALHLGDPAETTPGLDSVRLVFNTTDGAGARVSAEVQLVNDSTLHVGPSGGGSPAFALLLDGDLTLGTARNFAMQGGGTFSTGNGLVSLNGPIAADLTFRATSDRRLVMGARSGSGNGYNVLLVGGPANTSGDGGGVDLRGGQGAGGGHPGYVTLGAGDTREVRLGASVTTTHVYGDLQIDQNFSHQGTGTFGTGTGNVSLNGNVTVANGATFTLGNGDVAINGAITTNLSFSALGDHVVAIATATSGPGRQLYVAGGGASGTNQNGGGLFLTGGAGNGAGLAGAVNVGTLTSSAVNVGAPGVTTAVGGDLSLNGNVAQSNPWTFSTGNGDVTLNGDTAILGKLRASLLFRGDGDYLISGATATTARAGWDLTLRGGTGPASQNGGALTLSGGLPGSGGLAGVVNVGTANTSAVTLGTNLTPTGVQGDLTVAGTLSTTGTGTINLPNNGTRKFQIEGAPVAAAVTAANLGTLVGGGASNADALHTHAGLGAAPPATLSVVVAPTGTHAFTVNMTVRVGGTPFAGAIVQIRIKAPGATSFGTDLGVQRIRNFTSNNGVDGFLELACNASGVCQFNWGDSGGGTAYITVLSWVPNSAIYTAAYSY